MNFKRGLPILLVLVLPAAVFASPSRLKDIAVVNGLGQHKLLGYGLVAGLENTGDSDSSLLTVRSIGNMLKTFGVTVNQGDFSAKNMAAVIVTAELPPVVAIGSTLDVTVSSLCDAKSLQGGTLLLTPLRAVDNQVYAIAQGPLTIGGFSVATTTGDAAQKNHPTVGRVPNGASVVKGLNPTLTNDSKLTILLLQPDFTTAARIAEAINKAQDAQIATAQDGSTVQVTVPPVGMANLVGFIVGLENLSVEPDNAARVVINERTGTVVIGEHVRIDPVAICHGGLTVEVKAVTEVSQPPPLASGDLNGPVPALPTPALVTPASTTKLAPAVKDVTSAPASCSKPPREDASSLTGGKTVVVRQESLKVRESGGALVAIPEQATLQDLVTALNALGVKPRDLIAIIQALKEAHALQAELVLF